MPHVYGKYANNSLMEMEKKKTCWACSITKQSITMQRTVGWNWPVFSRSWRARPATVCSPVAQWFLWFSHSTEPGQCFLEAVKKFICPRLFCKAPCATLCFNQFASWRVLLPSNAIERTEFSTSQSNSLSVSMAFFTVFVTVLSSINFVTCDDNEKKNTSWNWNWVITATLKVQSWWLRCHERSPLWGSSSWWRSGEFWAYAAECPTAGRPPRWPVPSGTSCTAAW